MPKQYVEWSDGASHLFTVIFPDHRSNPTPQTTAIMDRAEAICAEEADSRVYEEHVARAMCERLIPV